MSGIDGRVSGLNRDVFQAMQRVRNPERMTEAEAKDVRKAVMKDGRMDAAERDLMKELTQNSGRVQIEAQNSAGFSPQALDFAVASGEAKERLDLLASPPNLNDLWNEGPEGITKLIDYYSISPQTANNATRFAAGKFLQAWNDSSWRDGFKNMRDVISTAYGAIKNADQQTHNAGREMYYDALKMVDQHVGDKIPDSLYNWVRPGGYI